MKLYRLHPKSSARVPGLQEQPDPAPAGPADAQTTEQPEALGNADFGGVVTSPKGTWRGHLYMAKHWRLFFFGIGAAGMLVLLADRLLLVLSALNQVLIRTGVPTLQ